MGEGWKGEGGRERGGRVRGGRVRGGRERGGSLRGGKGRRRVGGGRRLFMHCIISADLVSLFLVCCGRGEEVIHGLYHQCRFGFFVPCLLCVQVTCTMHRSVSHAQGISAYQCISDHHNVSHAVYLSVSHAQRSSVYLRVSQCISATDLL